MKIETKVVCTLTKDEKGKLMDNRDSLGIVAHDICYGMSCEGLDCENCPLDRVVKKIQVLMGDITDFVRNS